MTSKQHFGEIELIEFTEALVAGSWNWHPGTGIDFELEGVRFPGVSHICSSINIIKAKQFFILHLNLQEPFSSITLSFTEKMVFILYIIFCIDQFLNISDWPFSNTIINLMQDERESSKKIKKQATCLTEKCENQQQTKVCCNCNGEREIEEICGALLSLQNYTKYISVVIRHQEKSIESLPEAIKSMAEFKELSSRIQSCIVRAKINNSFLDLVSEGYSKQLLKDLHENQKDIDCLPPSLVLHSFVLVAKEWSDLFEGWRVPIHKTVGLVQKYKKPDHNKVLVQGAGMGRLLFELATQLTPCPVKIESIQDRPLHFLFGEYFIYKGFSKDSIYIFPYIHEFINHRQTNNPYRNVSVPSDRTKQWPENPNELVKTNFGQFEQKYRSNDNNNQWDILVSYICTDRVSNMLQWIQIAYKCLQEGGIWVVTSFSSFQRNILEMTYGQFREIIAKSQFTVCEEWRSWESLNEDSETMVAEVAEINYLVLRK